MAASDRPKDRAATWWSLKESFLNLFRWRQHIVYTDSLGVKHDRWETPEPLPNPITVWSGLTWRGFFAATIAFYAALVDALDYYGLGVQSVKLAEFYGVSKAEMSSANTVTMVTRFIGAIICGIWADYQGRKWVLSFNLFYLALIQVATVYAANFHQFLAVRALFGIGMGGIFGSAASFALEEIPVAARGIYSGIFQSAFHSAFFVAAVINLIVGPADYTWKTMFWVGAAMSFLVGVARAVFPESVKFVEARKKVKGGVAVATFCRGLVKMLRIEYPIYAFSIWFVCWYSVFGHTTNDSQVTFLIVSKGLSSADASRVAIISKMGAAWGCVIIAYLSQTFGRRRTMIVFWLLATVLLPASLLPNSTKGLIAGAFFNQFAASTVAVVPIYLSEISHPSFRSLVIGVSYQIGIMLSAPATQIVNIAAEKYHVRGPQGKPVEAYGPVIGIASTLSAILCVVILSVGPERLGRHFENAQPAVIDDGGMEDIDGDATKNASFNSALTEKRIANPDIV
ncbi:unnamed protein product [Parajaminaea phylloscopi]